MMAFGCSIMAGEEIENLPQIPKLLAKHFDEELINYAKVGSSNDEIIHTAFENITPGQTIIVGITDVARVYWPHHKADQVQSFSISNFKGKLTGLKNTLDSWYKFCYNEEVLEQYYYSKYKHLERYCHNMGNNIYFMNFCAGDRGVIANAKEGNWCTSVPSLIKFTDSSPRYGREPKGHPNSQAHIQYTRYLLETFPTLKEKRRK